jgi:hypothetical protein
MLCSYYNTVWIPQSLRETPQSQLHSHKIQIKRFPNHNEKLEYDNSFSVRTRHHDVSQQKLHPQYPQLNP